VIPSESTIEISALKKTEISVATANGTAHVHCTMTLTKQKLSSENRKNYTYPTAESCFEQYITYNKQKDIRSVTSIL